MLPRAAAAGSAPGVLNTRLRLVPAAIRAEQTSAASSRLTSGALMRTFIRADLLAGLVAILAATCGCGGNGNIGGCTYGIEVTVSPTSATVNHAAAPPANRVQFIGVGGYTASGEHCAVPALAWIAYGTWSNPDPTDITISSADDSTNGTAVCLAPTNGAVTLTGSFPTSVNPPQSVTQLVQLTCE